MKRLLLILAITCVLVSCGDNNTAKKQTDTKSAEQTDCVELLYFHGKKRCITCNAIERLTKEVVVQDFANQVKDGKLVFKVIDISTQEGAIVADKYEVAWSSLILQRNGGVKNLTQMGFNYAKNQPDIFKENLKESITQMVKE